MKPDAASVFSFSRVRRFVLLLRRVCVSDCGSVTNANTSCLAFYHSERLKRLFSRVTRKETIQQLQYLTLVEKFLAINPRCLLSSAICQHHMTPTRAPKLPWLSESLSRNACSGNSTKTRSGNQTKQNRGFRNECKQKV